MGFQDDLLPSSSKQACLAITAVPEPSTLVLLGIGGVLAGFFASRRRQRRTFAAMAPRRRDALKCALGCPSCGRVSSLASWQRWGLLEERFGTFVRASDTAWAKTLSPADRLAIVEDLFGVAYAAHERAGDWGAVDDLAWRETLAERRSR